MPYFSLLVIENEKVSGLGAAGSPLKYIHMEVSILPAENKVFDLCTKFQEH